MASRSHQAPVPRTRLALLGILAVALVLRLHGYAESVWIDELFTSDFFCGHPLVLARTLYSDIHPPAYFVFIHFWNQVFGDGEVWLRLPPLLSGLASIVLVAKLGERYLGRQVGLVAAALLALSPVHIWYSQEARPYATNLLLVLCAAYAYARRQDDARARWTWLYALSLFGTVFTHYYTAAYLVVFPLFARRDRAPRQRSLLLVNGVVGTLLALYMGAKAYFSHVPTAKSYLRGLDLGEAWELGFDWFLTGNSFTPRMVVEPAGVYLLPVLQLLAVLVFVRGAARLLRERERHGYHLLVHLAVLPGCLFALNLLGLDHTYIERSALPALPFFVLVLASGLTGWSSPRAQRTSVGTALVASIVILLFARVHERHWAVYKPNPDWRAAAAWIGERIDAGDAPRRLYTAPQSPSALTYYDPRIQEVKYFECNDEQIARLRERLAMTFGEDGFPGGWLQGQLRTSLAGLDEHVREQREGTAIEIRWLGQFDLLALPQSERPERVLLLTQFGPHPMTDAVLASPGARVIERHDVFALTLYEVELSSASTLGVR